MQRALTIVAIAVAIAVGAAVLWGPVFAFIGGFALLGLLRGAMTERVVVALVGATLIGYIATLISNAVADSNKAAEKKAVAVADQSHAAVEQLAPVLAVRVDCCGECCIAVGCIPHSVHMRTAHRRSTWRPTHVGHRTAGNDAQHAPRRERSNGERVRTAR